MFRWKEKSVNLLSASNGALSGLGGSSYISYSLGDLTEGQITQRFTINLPGGQKTVMRINPNLTLEQVLVKVCQEKHLEAPRYTFQHLNNPLTPLNMKSSVTEYRLTEINLIPAGMSPAAADYARSMPDLSKGGTSYDYSMAYMPETGETKKKRGLLSFLKKDKKFKPPTIQHSAEARLSTSQQKSMPQAHKPTTPPPERRRTCITPWEPLILGPRQPFLRPPPHEAGKKRPAPLPPGAREASEASTHTPASSVPGRDNTAVRETVSTGPKAGPDVMISRLHSRNSSDSSGYHELTLSGTESPEASRLRPNFKTSIDTTSIESTDANGDSGIQEVSPVSGSSLLSAEEDVYAVPMKSKAKQQTQKSAEKLKPIPSTKKKKAPPPSHQRGSSCNQNICCCVYPVIEEPEIKEHPTLDREEAEEPFSLEDILEGVDLDDESPFKVIDEPDEQWDDDEQEKQFMMVETASVLSEDVEVPEDFRLRPCAFNPPPPPLEPPPDYSPLESRKFADKSTVVGEDNASLAPLSLKSSPVAPRRRRDSQTSIDSVDTVEGVSLAFQEIISAAEEAMAAEGWMEGDGDYKNKMAVFSEKNKAAQADEDQFSNNISGSPQDTDSVSDSGSSSQSSFGQANNYGESEDSVTPEPDNSQCAHQNSVLENEFAMTEEIEAPVETVPPPLEFQNSEDTEDEEEVIVDSASSIGVQPIQTIDVVNPTPPQAEDKATIKKPVKESPPKEEFVLTTEDLKNSTEAVKGGSPSLAPKHIVADSKTSSSSQPVAKGDQPSFVLPSMRIISVLEPPGFSDDDASSENTDDYRYQSTVKLLMENHSEDVSSPTDDSSERRSSTSSRHLSDASSSSISSAVGELQSDLTEEEKYQQLQQNLTRWQQQLLHNQLETQSQQHKPPKSLQKDPTPSPPHPPSPPSAPKLVKTWEAPKQQRPPAKKFEPQLDPREELMIAIRSFGGRQGFTPSKLGSDA
ncbi:hypothetical protein C0Q70_10426 [Pomacea canaliculata]|uniref:Uncharacterized protein n=1 Tax=Pomacea canaliculata TaxID=400727 RepID=A0A2T7PCJ8_POMCA|nr:hypothetical protein C0Q70_10426 [Pomacea canaliculata]